MSNKLIDITTLTQDDSEPYDLLYDKVFSNLRVFSLAYYKNIVSPFSEAKKYGIVNVRPFPLDEFEDSDVSQVYCFSKKRMETLKEGDIVGIIYSDMNFKFALDDPKRNVKKNPSKLKHTSGYGILVDVKNETSGEGNIDVEVIDKTLYITTK